MTAPTKTKPAAKPAPKPGPKGKAPANPAPAAPVEAPAVKPAGRTGNSAYAAESVRNQITEALEKLWTDGWTRPAVSAITGFSDSQVWRATNRKVHEAEVPVLMEFLKGVVNGEHTPPQRTRKVKAADLEARIAKAVEALGSEAKTAAQYRKVIADALEVLSA